MPNWRRKISMSSSYVHVSALKKKSGERKEKNRPMIFRASKILSVREKTQIPDIKMQRLRSRTEGNQSKFYNAEISKIQWCTCSEYMYMLCTQTNEQKKLQCTYTYMYIFFWATCTHVYPGGYMYFFFLISFWSIILYSIFFHVHLVIRVWQQLFNHCHHYQPHIAPI